MVNVFCFFSFFFYKIFLALLKNLLLFLLTFSFDTAGYAIQIDNLVYFV